MKRFLFTLLASLMVSIPSGAQFFEEFRPMYYIGGVPLEGPVNKSTADIKFQLSLAIPFWKDLGNREGTDLFFGYTQITLWDFFDESAPFYDTCYNPGLYLSIPMQKDRELLLGVEHRSNGRPMRGSIGDTYSRSINYVSGQYGVYYQNGMVFKASLRAGYGWYDDELTLDLFTRFFGFGDITLGYRSPDSKLEMFVTATPLFCPFNFNVEAAASYDIGFCSLFTQFNYGYAEALSNWVRGYRPAPYLRVGVLFGKML